MEQSSPPRRRRFWLYAPLVFVLVLAAAWTGGWFYAANRAGDVITAWMEREASFGRTYACGSRQIGGYPFRIEVRCNEPSATLHEGGEPVVLKARSLMAVAQVYQPTLVIAEAIGPMTVTMASGEQLFVANWKLLQTSVRGPPRAPQRASLVVDEPKLDRAGAPGGETVGFAHRFELHMQRSPSSTAENPVFDLAARVIAASIPLVPALAERPFDVDALAVLRGLKDFSGGRTLPQRLREWQAAGGRLELTKARIQQGEGLAFATGELGLTPQGRVDGVINLRLAGLDHLANLLLGQGGQGRSGLLTGLSILGRSELEGRRAVAVPVNFRDGRVFFGPIPVGQLAPLY
jgi:hypothetical protein